MSWCPLASLERFAMESVRWAFSYCAWHPCREDWLLAMRLVQPEEKERIGQFVFACDAKAAMAGRLLIRKLISEKLKIPWNEIQLQRTPKGKPVLANDSSNIPPGFNFNVSHQGNYAVLAAEPDRQVGIDIMKTTLPGHHVVYLDFDKVPRDLLIKKLIKCEVDQCTVEWIQNWLSGCIQRVGIKGSDSIPNFFRIMNRQFTEEEWRVITSMNREWLQLTMFHRHWALKESFIKAIGVGLGFDLQRIEFNVSPMQLEVGKTYNETVVLLDGEQEKEWTFEETRLDDCHHVAVALGKLGEFEETHGEMLSTDVRQATFTMLTFEDLVASAVPLAPEDPVCWDNFCSRQESPTRQSSNSR